jgi:inosine-uridine nucleoside N-ribohydrolase
MADQIPVLFDTDIGSDIDDAVALAYLLAEPRCDLLGVTTVTGDVAKRAALVQLLCEAAGRPDIRIHCGASAVLLDGPGQPEVPQYETVQHLAHPTDWPQGTAVDFLRQTIRERPGEITLLGRPSHQRRAALRHRPTNSVAAACLVLDGRRFSPRLQP